MAHVDLTAVRQVWLQKIGYAPTILYAVSSGKYYVTISDNRTVLSFLGKTGDIYSVYVAVKSKCIVTHTSDSQYYAIQPDALQVVSCTHIVEPLDVFVMESIAPVFFPP